MSHDSAGSSARSRELADCAAKGCAAASAASLPRALARTGRRRARRTPVSERDGGLAMAHGHERRPARGLERAGSAAAQRGRRRLLFALEAPPRHLGDARSEGPGASEGLRGCEMAARAVSSGLRDGEMAARESGLRGGEMAAHESGLRGSGLAARARLRGLRGWLGSSAPASPVGSSSPCGAPSGVQPPKRRANIALAFGTQTQSRASLRQQAFETH
jgi:hypothetical protein